MRDALASPEIDAHRAEHARVDGSAVMWAVLPDGEVFVNVHPLGVVGDSIVVGEREVEGFTVTRVDYTEGDLRDQFSCGGAYVEAFGVTPAKFSDFGGFLAAFRQALDC